MRIEGRWALGRQAGVKKDQGLENSVDEHEAGEEKNGK